MATEMPLTNGHLELPHLTDTGGIMIANHVRANISGLARKYATAAPFPHIVIDDFLESKAAEDLHANFPAMEQMPNVFKEPMSYKGQLRDIDGKWPKFSDVFNTLQSQDFRDLMSQLSGIDGLLADPILAGGGVHQSPRSGFLDIHVDANFHPLDKTMHRRVNILIYLNKDWQTAWGGALQLWDDVDKKPDRLIHEVQPVFNRAVIFSTNRTSWHGVSPINCPDGTSRKSLALYYYTNTRPQEEQYRDSSVIWMNKTNPLKKVLYPLMNAGIAILKPYAKYIRRNVFDAAKK